MGIRQRCPLILPGEAASCISQPCPKFHSGSPIENKGLYRYSKNTHSCLASRCLLCHPCSPSLKHYFSFLWLGGRTLSRSNLIILIGSLILLPTQLWAADWPQFLGPQRNGFSKETGLIDNWPEDGPKEVWRVAGGVGMSGISVSQGKLVTLIQREGRQWMMALDPKLGKTLWVLDLAPAYKYAMGDGPRSTPTIEGDEVFAVTGEGKLVAVSLVDGKLLWSADGLKQLRGEIADYGMACSPLLWQDRVIVNLGAPKNAVAAFDRKTGALLWGAGTGPAGYSSPVMMEVGGREQIVALTGDALLGLSPDKGEVLWQYPFITDFSCNIAAPLVHQGRVFISAGENHGSVLLDVKPKGAGFSATEAWASLGPKSVMRNEWQTSLVIGDHLYGFDNVGGAGPISHLACIEVLTGKPVWQKARFGKGNMIWADGKILMTTIDGEFVLARVNPEGYTELGRRKVLEKTRQAPSLSDGLLYLRDDRDIVCLDVRQP